MAMARQFIGWDTPLLPAVCDTLLSEDSVGVDLSDFLIVVPTRHAGRRLREALARHCAERGAGLLSPTVVTPSVLRYRAGASEPIAPPLLVSAVWAELLLKVELSQFPNLFPVAPTERDLAWALDTGELLEELRESLAEGGFRCRDLDTVEGLPEPMRWRDLAMLEPAFNQRLRACGYADPCERITAPGAEPVLPDGIGRIVVAATPDPPPSLMQSLEVVSERLPVTILVHAPEAECEAFDSWGRPRADVWSTRVIPMPESEVEIRLAGSPTGQAAMALEWIRDLPLAPGPGDLSLGVADRSVVAHVTAALKDENVPAYDPAGERMGDHAICHLLDAWNELAGQRTYAGLQATLRHPDVLGWLQTDHGVSASALLEELDRFQNRHLPTDLDDIHHHLSHRGERFETLAAAVAQIEEQVDKFDTASLADSVSVFLQAVYRHREVSGTEEGGRRFMAAATRVREALDEWDDAGVDGLGLSGTQRFPLLLRSLQGRVIYPERERGAMDLEGWLELPWNDAPWLAVMGMNEGSVPDGRPSDAFLPDALRRLLNLNPDGQRLARDAFLLRGMTASRQGHGRTLLIAGKTSSRGDPLKPSRLLFRCPDEELTERAELLFGDVVEERENLPATVSFALDPERGVSGSSVERMHVTAFSNYLACPFRFYLRHVGRLEPLDDAKPELDARDFGNLVHDALEQMARTAAIAESTDADEIGEFLCGAATRWVQKRVGSHPPLQIALQLDAARQRLIAAARKQAELVAEGWRIESAEHRIDTRIGSMRIVGKIDRIDRHLESGELRVIDYKTSDTAVAPEKAHLGTLRDDTPAYAVGKAKGKPKAWTNLQLPLYRMLLEATGTQEPMTLGYFALPKAIQNTGLDLWTTFDDDLLASARECVAGVIGDVEAGRFWPPRRVAERIDDFAHFFHGDPEQALVQGGLGGEP